MFYISTAIMLFDMWFNIILRYTLLTLYIRVYYGNVVTSASEQNFNSGDMALNKYILYCYYYHYY